MARDVYKRQSQQNAESKKVCEQEKITATSGKDVIQLEQRMAELAAADAARTKKHHERHAAAPEPVSYTHLDVYKRQGYFPHIEIYT